jgi:long-chain acyl-CoA synthetase
MVVNPFKPKPVLDPGAELLRTSQTPLTIPSMLADTRARHGEHPAIQQKSGTTWRRSTFDDIYRRAHDFGAGLIALGLKKGDRVALIFENGIEWAVAYFGMSLAGGVGVPLYYELKPGEIKELVKRSGARYMVVSSRVFERLGDRPPGVDSVIVVGGTEARPGQPPRFLRRGRPDLMPFDQVAEQATDDSRIEVERRHIEPDDLASIVFTSGTTGGMKGVMLTHKNLMSNVESARRMFQVDRKDRIVLVLPLHHAFPFVIFLIGFSVGGEITFENDLPRVRDRLREVKPTVFLGVPPLFEQVYRAIVRRAEAEGRLEMFQRGLRASNAIKRRTGVNLGKLIFREIHQQLGGQLRFTLSGGAALKPEIARSFFRLGIPLLQGWGLSEASPVVSTQRWFPSKFFFSNFYEDQVGSVGPPIEGVEVKLIDVPEKEIYVHLHGEGELVVRGPNVFAGYWQAPEATAAALAGGWLRTGDLGRFDEEGNIWITGRSKYVIVLDSGEKVVPDELEERLGQSELIQDVCVVARKHRDRTQVGAVIYPSHDVVRRRLAERSEELSEATVRKVVQEELDAIAQEMAAYKRITDVQLSDSPLPKTALQDVARGQLRESYTFDAKRWEESGRALAGPPLASETAPSGE